MAVSALSINIPKEELYLSLTPMYQLWRIKRNGVCVSKRNVAMCSNSMAWRENIIVIKRGVSYTNHGGNNVNGNISTT